MQYPISSTLHGATGKARNGKSDGSGNGNGNGIGKDTILSGLFLRGCRKTRNGQERNGTGTGSNYMAIINIIVERL